MNDFVQSSSGHLNGIKLAAATTSNLTVVATSTKTTATTSNLAANSNFSAVPNSAQEFVDSKNGLQKKKKSANLMPTIRFELKLEPPTSEKSSEFNYNKLAVKTLKIVRKKSKSTKSSNTENEDETKRKCQSIDKQDLEILSSEFKLERSRILSLLSHYRKKVILSKEEETNENNLLNTDLACETNDGFHGNTAKNDNDDNSMDSESSVNNNNDNNNVPVKISKKPRKKANQYDSENNQYKLKDFNYLGQGYDEEDSFIDNSEAIDERVPADMAPKKGGFYINKGNLKMEKIEEQRAKAKLARKQAKSTIKLLQKESKIKSDSNGHGDEDSSTDEDFNPNEMNEEVAANEVDMSGNVNGNDDSSGSSSSGSSDSDSDSDGESYESDEDSEGIEEVSGIEDQNLDEVKLRNKKLIKTAVDMKSSDSNSCEIIEIASSSNSNASVAKNSKRRIIDDSDNELEVNGHQGKENIENKSSQNLPVIKKRKRIKEGSNGASSEMHANNVEMNELPCAKLARPETENLAACSSNQKSEPGELVVSLPVNISVKMKAFIEQFVSTFKANNTQVNGNVWTEDLKATLLRIYQESQTHTQADRSNIFTYMSKRTGKTREVLMRHCRTQSKLLENNTAAAQQPQPQTQVNTANKAQNDAKAVYYQKLNNESMNSPTVGSNSHQQQITPTLNDLNEDLKNKLIHLEKSFTIFKQKNEPTNKFFETPKISNLIHSVDIQTKHTPSNTQPKQAKLIREFTLNHMCKTFDITREMLINTLARLRTQHTNNLIQNKLTTLKQKIDEEMPKQLVKYKLVYDEYLRNKSAYDLAVTSEADKKKLFPPRKKFEWTVALRDIYLQLMNLKGNLFRSSSKAPSQSPVKHVDLTEEETNKRNEYIKAFLTTSLLPLWPENWMQLNVLIHMTKSGNSQSHRGHNQTHQSRNQQQQPPNTSSNTLKNNAVNTVKSPVAAATSSPAVQINKPFVTNGSIINLASKSGKKITLEHQPLAKPQLPVNASYHSTTANPIIQTKPLHRPTTPQSQLNHRQSQPQHANDNNNKLTKTSPPIPILTNTRPPNMSNSGTKPKTNSQFNNNAGSKQNSSMNLEKALKDAQTLKLSPSTTTIQHLQYLQAQLDLGLTYNAANCANNGQFANNMSFTNLNLNASQGNLSNYSKNVTQNHSNN